MRGKSVLLSVLVSVFTLTTPVLAERTFYWSMESDTPDVYPAGTDNTPGYSYTTHRSTNEAHSGDYSLALGDGSWRCAVFDNPTNDDIWAPVEQGTISLWFKYSENYSGGMLMQLTGKAQHTNPALDTNDGFSLRFKDQNRLDFGFGYDGEDAWGTTRLRYSMAGGFQPGQWYHVVASWNVDGGDETMSLSVNGDQVTGSNYLGKTKCEAWHQILIGNDLSLVATGLYLDDFAIYDTYIPEPASCSLLVIGAWAILGRRRK